MLLLPEGDFGPALRAHDAAPPRRPLARRQEDGGAQVLRALGGLVDALDADVGQPERALRAALDDAAAEAVAEGQREVGAVAGLDALRGPAAEPLVVVARAALVAGVELQMDDRS